MKKSIAVFIAFFNLLLVSNIFSQDQSIELKTHSRLDTFDLSKYVLPDLEYKTLNLSFDFNSNNSIEHRRGYNNDYDERYFHIAGSGNLNSYCYKNSPEFQSKGRSYLSLSSLYEKFETYKSSRKYSNKKLGLNFLLERNIKYYFRAKRFLGLNIYTQSYIHDIENNAFQNVINNHKYLDFNISTGFNYGFGRIEDVTNAWNTILILKDFARLDILDHNPNDEEIMQIADVISKIKSVRFYDYRLRRIAEFKAIDKILKTNNLITNDGIEYFTSLNDMYYSNRFRRFAGSTFTFGITPKYSIYRNFDEDEDIFQNYGLSIGLEYTEDKPINMFWQLDMKYRLVFDYLTNTYNQNSNNFSRINFYPRVSASLSYFPSTRTQMNSNIELRYNYKLWDDNEFTELDDDDLVIIWDNSINYYLSPKVSLRGVLRLMYGSGHYSFSSFTNLPQDIGYYGPIGDFSNYEGFGYKLIMRFNYIIL